MSRTQRIAIAEQTLKVIGDQGYQLHNGQPVSITLDMQACLAGTKLLRPEDFKALEQRIREKLALRSQSKPVEMSLLAETTFGTCRRWVQGEGYENVACLNFASAKNPGGGFLNGSQAQEEALSRASGLYASLITQEGYYEFNRKHGTSLYSDHMIWSPRVPVFRDDADALMAAPYAVGIITAPAVNAGAVRQNEPDKTLLIKVMMASRAAKVLGLAVDEGVENLVLGAWGCGVFANDPTEVADIFMRLLQPSGPFGRAFQRVAFSIPDGGSSGANYAAFQARMR